MPVSRRLGILTLRKTASSWNNVLLLSEDGQIYSFEPVTPIRAFDSRSHIQKYQSANNEIPSLALRPAVRVVVMTAFRGWQKGSDRSGLRKVSDDNYDVRLATTSLAGW